MDEAERSSGRPGKTAVLGALFAAFLLWRGVDSAARVAGKVRFLATYLAEGDLDASVEERLERVLGRNAELYRFLRDALPRQGYLYALGRPAHHSKPLDAVLFPWVIFEVEDWTPAWRPELDDRPVYLLAGPEHPVPEEAPFRLVARHASHRLFRVETGEGR